MPLTFFGVGRKRNKYPLLSKLEIVDIAAEGKSIGRYEGMIVFVPHVIPGDIVDVQIKNKRKKFMEGYVVNFHKYSDLRIKAFCEHFGVCGGCKWQHLPYSDQLKYKQKQVADSLERIGKIVLPEINPIIASDNTTHYRNKLEYTFSENRWLSNEEIKLESEVLNRFALGFHIPGRFDRVLDITNCYLQPSPSNEIRKAVKEYTEKHNLRYYDHVKQEGFLRNLIIRNTSTGEVMVVVSFFEEKKDEIEGLLNHLNNNFPGVTSFMYVINPKGNDTINDLEINLYKGRDHIIEDLDGLKFKIGPKSFFQTNSGQALKLYRITKDFAGLTGNENVYDLYTGTGTIALYLAGSCQHVTGIEYVPEAIEDAKENTVFNNINNADFFAGDIKAVLNEGFVNLQGHPDVMIIDPPRAGMHEDVVKQILTIQPPRIVYVSCNPATQARDIHILSEKYTVKKVQPVDMFPHTHHVENVVLMELKF